MKLDVWLSPSLLSFSPLVPFSSSQIPVENPWVLLLTTNIRADQRELPLGMFALETRVVDGVAQPLFVSYRFTIETFEMERITIDHVSSLKHQNESESARTSLPLSPRFELAALLYREVVLSTPLVVFARQLSDSCLMRSLRSRHSGSE